MTSNTVDVFVCMDSDGDYEIGKEAEDAITNYNDNIGGCLPLRVIKLKVVMAPPVITETTVEVKDEAGQQVAAAAE